MHFTAVFTILALPASILAGVLPPVSQRETDMTAEQFVDSTGKTRTVYYSRSLFRRSSSEEAELASTTPVLKKRAEFIAGDEDSNKCGQSSFVDKSSGGSPTVADCQCLRDYLRGKKGVYIVNESTPRWDQFATCGTCAFGVDTANFFGTVVGNTDAADVMTDAIDMFQWNGLIGAEGHMGCDNGFETAGTDWAIYHS